MENLSVFMVTSCASNYTRLIKAVYVSRSKLSTARQAKISDYAPLLRMESQDYVPGLTTRQTIMELTKGIFIQ
jgi:hypothetical protein